MSPTDRVKKRFFKANPVGFIGFWGFIGFLGLAEKIGKIIQKKLSNLKP